ncbi:hypothetical protein A3A09_03775 [Candidatus Nomurabacteria bacterium RIFCSPLOWO2_01_FULL_42_20]|nr:MAG: hypothetical protein A3A09_03775 [Candidatus Nomurabacteria bacterium RIFCSPLOWO2_01_FULL_42_20]
MGNFKRILKAGWINFTRNGVVSAAAVLVMTITLSVIGSLIFLQAVLQNSLEGIKDKVDITIYFTLNTSEDKIFSLKGALEKLPEVKAIAYVSADEALQAFRKKHENDYLVIQALEELDENPLNAYLNVKAMEASQYEGIVKFLEGDSAKVLGGASIIDKINYNQNKFIIDRLVGIINGAQKLGFIVTAILILISILVTFNTIRLAIFTFREEIRVMRLVGASRAYIRGPFLVEGAISGILSGLIAMLLFLPATLWLGNKMTTFLGLNLFEYYLQNIWQMLVILLGFGILLGVISSFLAVNKYLKA